MLVGAGRQAGGHGGRGRAGHAGGWAGGIQSASVCCRRAHSAVRAGVSRAPVHVLALQPSPADVRSSSVECGCHTTQVRDSIELRPPVNVAYVAASRQASKQASGMHTWGVRLLAHAGRHSVLPGVAAGARTRVSSYPCHAIGCVSTPTSPDPNMGPLRGPPAGGVDDLAAGVPAQQGWEGEEGGRGQAGPDRGEAEQPGATAHDASSHRGWELRARRAHGGPVQRSSGEERGSPRSGCKRGAPSTGLSVCLSPEEPPCSVKERPPTSACRHALHAPRRLSANGGLFSFHPR